MLIRKIELNDSENFLKMCKSLDNETSFMMYEPKERETTLEDQTTYIKNLLDEDYSLLLVCEVNGKIVGYISATREKLNRIRHSAYIVIGILQEYTGQGIGTRLFQKMENWAISKHIKRLELTVMCHNTAAIRLYKKMGFQIEGTKNHSMIIDHMFIDEYYMAKLL